MRLLALLTIISLTSCRYEKNLPAAREPLRLGSVPVQYDDYAQATFAVSPAEWDQIKSLFARADQTPTDEREEIRQAVALLEQIAGRQTPTSRDLAKNKINPQGAGNMDCVDESTNTTTYLRLLQEQGLLRWHLVLEKAFRGPFQLDTHWTGQIRDRTTGQRYVVDSWYRDNGQPPYVQPTEQWMRKTPFPKDQRPADDNAQTD